MKITVNEQPQQFYLAFKEWTPAVGHGIKVGNYQFCAIPTKDVIIVSEVTTGANVMNIPLDLVTRFMTVTKESTIDYFYIVGERIKKILEKQSDFDGMLAEMQKITYELLGDMPEIKNIELEG